MLERAATALGLAVGLWTALLGMVFGSSYWCPNNVSCPLLSGVSIPSLIPYFGAALTIFAIASLTGFRAVFAASAVLSAVTSALVVQYALEGIRADIVLLLLALIAAVLNFLASRHGGRMSEQSNPMNLPVFG